MSLIRNFAMVGSGTAGSRVLGFVRDMFMAAALGTGAVADAFFVAFRFPNLFRRLFAEGAFNSAFIPLFGRALDEGGVEEAKRFGRESLSALLTLLLIVIGVAEIAMPILMYVMAPGFSADPQKFDLAVLLTRIAFPYLALASLLALFSGVLNARGRFAAAAFAPTALNLVFIVALVIVLTGGYADSPDAGIILSIATVIGGVLQLAVVVWAANRIGLGLRPVRPRLTPGVKRLWKLAVPGVFAGGITQINIVIGTIIASLSPGAVSYLYYADRVYQLPLGVVGVAIGVVLLPDLTRQLRGGREDVASHTQNRALEFSMALTLPAAVALVVLSLPIIRVLFERGEFTMADSLATSWALAAFAAGLPGFVLIKVFQPAFFAREDTRTPMWCAAASVVINVAGSIALFPSLSHVGIAIATAAAGWINAIVLGIILWRRGHFRPDHAIEARLPFMLLAAGLMGIGIHYAGQALSGLLTDASILIRASALGALVVAGVVLFALLVQVTGVVDFRKQFAAIRGRRAARAAAQEPPLAPGDGAP